MDTDKKIIDMVMKAKGKRQIEKSIIDEIMEEDEEED
jgi:hypothetical protein